jgi:hypothetical protein
MALRLQSFGAPARQVGFPGCARDPSRCLGQRPAGRCRHHDKPVEQQAGGKQGPHGFLSHSLQVVGSDDAREDDVVHVLDDVQPAQFAKIANLTERDLGSTAVTDAGTAELRATRPRCKMTR